MDRLEDFDIDLEEIEEIIQYLFEDKIDLSDCMWDFYKTNVREFVQLSNRNLTIIISEFNKLIEDLEISKKGHIEIKIIILMMLIIAQNKHSSSYIFREFEEDNEKVDGKYEEEDKLILLEEIGYDKILSVASKINLENEIEIIDIIFNSISKGQIDKKTIKKYLNKKEIKNDRSKKEKNTTIR